MTKPGAEKGALCSVGVFARLRNIHGGCVDRSFIKLVKNFRSHSGILDFPNRRFYGGELEPCADPERVNAFIGSPHLVTSDFPVIFHAISGKDEREGSSPSYFNIDEVTEGVDYIQKLTSDSRYPLGTYTFRAYFTVPWH